jgi:hypothetical protein
VQTEVSCLRSVYLLLFDKFGAIQEVGTETKKEVFFSEKSDASACTEPIQALFGT